MHSNHERRRQLTALLRRNLLLKRRQLPQTIAEIVIPVVIYIAVSFASNSLKAAKAGVSLPMNTTVEYQDVEINFNGTYQRPGPVLVVVNTRNPALRNKSFEYFRKVLGSSGNVELVSRSSDAEIAKGAMKRRYLYYRRKAVDKMNQPVGVVINLDRAITKNQLSDSSMPFSGGIDLNLMDNLIGIYMYQIVLATTDLPNIQSGQFYDTSPDSCLPDKFTYPTTNVDPSKLSASKCSALYYTRTDFLHLQNAAQRTILKFTETCDSKEHGVDECSIDISNMTSSVKWKMMPRTTASDTAQLKAGTELNAAWSSLTVYLAGFSVIALFSSMVSGAVTEKEKGFRETMLLMGMNATTWKFSWFIVYFVEIIIVSGLSTIITWQQNVVSPSGSGIFFILLLSYGFALIAFAQLLIMAFNTARSANTATSFVFGVLGLPYIIIKVFTIFSKKLVPVAGYYLLSLLFPFAFQSGLDYLLQSEEGSTSMPDVTAWGMILMLLLDGFIYLLIGLLCDTLPGRLADRRLAMQRAVSNIPNPEHNGGLDEESARNVEVDPSLEDKKAIVISNLTKSFRRTAGQALVNAVDNLSLTIYGGQITCLLGHNGAGKTTLLRILTGSLKEYSGTVNIFNWHVESCRDVEELRRDIGVCAQQNTLFDNLTVAEHLNFVLEMKSDLNADARKTTVAETMALICLTDRANTYGIQLSGGEKRKLCLAMAVISKPKLLFLDEPTAGVDVYCRRQIWDVLTQYKQADRAVLLTTHYMDEADMLADRKALMHRGRLYSAGSSMFLRQRFGCGYRLTVELDASADPSKTSEITTAFQVVMPSIVQMESERSRSELVYALPTGEGNVDELLSLLQFLESDQTKLAQLGVQCYGWSIATLDEVFMKLEEEVAEHDNEEQTPTSSLPNRKGAFFFRKRPVESKITAGVKPGYLNNIWKRKPSDTSNNKTDHPEHLPPTLSFQGIEAPEGSPDSMGRHYVAVLYLRLMTSLRNLVVLMMRFFFPIIITILGLAMARVLMSQLLPILQNLSDSSHVNETAIYAYQPFIYTNMSSSIADQLKKVMAKQFEGDEQNDFIKKISTFEGNSGPFILMMNLSSNTTRAQASSQNIQVMSSTLMKTIEADVSAKLQDLIANYGSKVGLSSDMDDFGVITGDKLIFSHTAIHALPSLFSYAHSMEVLTATSAQDNMYLPIFLPLLNSFTSASRDQVIQGYISNFIFTLLFAMHVLTMLPSLGYDVVRDRESGCATQIKLAGISKLSYWLGSFTVDAVEYAIFLLFFLLLAFLFGVHSFKFAGAYYAFLLLILLVVPANVLMIYCLSLCFKTFRIFSSVVSLVVFLTGFFPFLAVFFWSISTVMSFGNSVALPSTTLQSNSDWQTLLAVFSFLFPAFNAAAGVFLVVFVSQPNIATFELPTPDTEAYFADKGLTYLYVGSAIQIAVFTMFIVIFETWSDIRRRFSKAIHVPSYSYTKRGQSFTASASEFSLQCDEDEDVANERRDVTELETSDGDISSSPAPYVSQVRKVYTTFCRDCKPVEPKCAVEDVSFKLNCGQVFGLLGPNGAGKTTLIKMIIGSESPTAGNIFSSGSTGLGYCPQDNVLWDQLSGEEHIFIYSFARGFSATQRRELTRRLADGLGISSHLKKQTKRMSGGTKRKLCVALSLVGRPSVLCLDEPSAGMDPGSKRFLWRVIKQIFTNQQSDWNIAALLTTHHLDEAEALCHRIAIMVNGVLRCIGSRQHLKTKYGRYYTLEVKLGDKNVPFLDAAQLIEYINALLPEASISNEKEAPQLINSFGRHFVFRIPSCRVRSLADIFSELESQKRTGCFASYSFSQVSLEQIFIQFAKDQYED